MVRITLAASILAFLPLSVTLADEPAAKAEPIVQIKGAMPNQEAFKDSKATAPIVIKSADDAARYFDEQALAKLNAAVDFKQQVVLVFAWRGSGGDKLSYEIKESAPEQIAFKLKRGLTRDLRPHMHVYALRSDVTWTVEKAGLGR